MQIKDLINMTLPEAKEKFAGENIKWRIVSVDNSPSVITADFNPDRINLKIQSDKEIITDAYYG